MTGACPGYAHCLGEKLARAVGMKRLIPQVGRGRWHAQHSTARHLSRRDSVQQGAQLSADSMDSRLRVISELPPGKPKLPPGSRSEGRGGRRGGSRSEARVEYELRHARLATLRAAELRLDDLRRDGVISDESFELLAAESDQGLAGLDQEPSAPGKAP